MLESQHHCVNLQFPSLQHLVDYRALPTVSPLVSLLVSFCVSTAFGGASLSLVVKSKNCQSCVLLWQNVSNSTRVRSGAINVSFLHMKKMWIDIVHWR